ncbi:hypothetical protein [Variovorax rhizosphaerae]|uniref:Uncharacterized protein n=1 Tax=Variovorax rhizosphaerae TaxID=1836200 RepID=A0ABU8WRF8_9BURK
MSWLIVRGKRPAELRAQFGFFETGKREFVPESDVTEALLPSGWHLIFFNDASPPEIGDEALCRISRGAEAMAFVVEEASMVSLARGYAGGKRIWEVLHDSNEGLEHLAVSGEPPKSFPAIRDRLLNELRADQDPCDYLFDVPADLSKAEAGFRHDEDIEGVEGDAFAILERS